MSLSPCRAAIEARINDVIIAGVRDVKITSKRTHKEITVDDDPEVRRMGLLKDADLGMTIVRSPGDAGQAAILASDRNNTQCEYVILKGAAGYIAFVVTAAVAQLSFPSLPTDENIMEVELSASVDIMFLSEGMI